MKVIAINDAPIPIRPSSEMWYGKYKRKIAYDKGDIFDTQYFTDKSIVIYNHHFDNNTMDVRVKNFITLSEWRLKQIDKII